MKVQTVILAAGKGKRMHSALPKVLHTLAGKPLLEHMIETAMEISAKPIIVFGYQGRLIQNKLSHFNINWIEQKDQFGTGHAVLQALPHIKNDQQVLILCGDVPLLQVDTLKKLISKTPANAIGMLTAVTEKPCGYGRIKRNAQQKIIGIVEEKDASEIERNITEINPGIYLIPGALLKKYLPQINNKNSQKEYYLTDLISLAHQEGVIIHTVQSAESEEVLGVNDRAQLASLERFYQRKLATQLMQRGVTIMDPERIDIRGEVEIGVDVVIDVNVILEGRVVIGNNCVIGANSILRNTTLNANVEVKPHSLIDGAEIGENSVIGPFARLRPGTFLHADVHVGNFVEVKNSDIGSATKINHLSYIGDSEIGKHVNIGAGTITCNYDGANKHKTVIGDNTHIGSDTQLVAPVTIGEGATIGAGSTITKNVPPHKLTLTHKLDQRIVKSWARPEKKIVKSKT